MLRSKNLSFGSKKKGFTLIELLAVIVIVAIISLIATPLIMNVIKDSKDGAYESQKKMIEHAAELYYVSHFDDLIWDGDTTYIELVDLKDRGYLKQNITNPLSGVSIPDDTKVIVYKAGDDLIYSLQLYDDSSFKWYEKKMVNMVKSMNLYLPNNIGDKITVDLDDLISAGKIDEIRIPTDITSRCVGYVDIEKTSTKNYEYSSYIDCLLGASTFFSNYVSFGGKYMDEFEKVIATSDGGYLAVGRSNTETINKYNIISNGVYDAIIVKFNSSGTVEWTHNFGGLLRDRFYSVIEIDNGYIAVGETFSGELSGFKGGNSDALIVKYDKSGNLISSKVFGNSGNEGIFFDIISSDNQVIVTGKLAAVADGDLSDFVIPSDYKTYMAVNIIFDMNLNYLKSSIIGGNSYNQFQKTIRTSDGGFISIGYTNSNNSVFADLKYIKSGYNYEGLIVKYDGDFNIEKIKLFSGTGHSYFNDIIEVDDGYILVGNSVAYDNDMEGLNKSDNGLKDAIIVKYDKSLQNIMWKKSFGGSGEDTFQSIVKNNNSVIVVGSSKSNDMDMNNISKSNEGYRNAILVEYNISNGNLVNKKVFGGSNSESFNSIVKNSDNNYIVAGSSFSTNKDLKNFNKGHQDAILVAYDNKFNLTKKFNEEVVIIDKLQTITADYGAELSLDYTNIYTSNNPEVDLKGWCSSYTPSGINNYDYSQCLKPLNDDDMKLLNNIETPNYYKQIISGEKEYTIDNKIDNYTDWLYLHFRMVDGKTDLSNLKIKFKDGYIGSIEEGINTGYIEPLVTVSNILIYAPYNERTYPNTTGILYTNGILNNVGSYPDVYLLFKPKKEVVSIIFTSTRTMTTNIDRGFSIYELRNFDMSINPTN